jgi:hypothetical protein
MRYIIANIHGTFEKLKVKGLIGLLNKDASEYIFLAGLYEL